MRDAGGLQGRSDRSSNRSATSRTRNSSGVDEVVGDQVPRCTARRPGSTGVVVSARLARSQRNRLLGNRRCGLRPHIRGRSEPPGPVDQHPPHTGDQVVDGVLNERSRTVTALDVVVITRISANPAPMASAATVLPRHIRQRCGQNSRVRCWPMMPRDSRFGVAVSPPVASRGLQSRGWIGDIACAPAPREVRLAAGGPDLGAPESPWSP